MNNLNKNLPKIIIDKPTILLMFSGGLDSLGALYVLLTNPTYENFEIHVHHIELINEENRSLAELNSVNKILEWFNFSNLKKVSYSSSIINIPSCNERFLWDSDILNFISGYISSYQQNIKHVAFGVTKNDLEDTNLNQRITRSRQIFEIFNGNDINKKIYPVQTLSKHEIYDLLPSDLRELSWSCRTPIYLDGIPYKCNKCKACDELRSL